MTTTIKNLAAAAAIVAGAIISAPGATAADIVFEGRGAYHFGGAVNYYKNGIEQGGRYKNLGADDYRKCTINVDHVTNRSKSATGTLSLEFWAMPYKGATAGIILMTKGLEPLPKLKSYNQISGYGYAIYLDRRKFPEFNIWERTRSGWKFRDALKFTAKRRL